MLVASGYTQEERRRKWLAQHDAQTDYDEFIIASSVSLVCDVERARRVQAADNRDRFDVGFLRHAGRVGHKRQWLVGWGLERFFSQLVPDRFMNPLRVTWVRRKKVDDQDVNALKEEVEGLFDKARIACLLFLLPGDTSSMIATTSPSGL